MVQHPQAGASAVAGSASVLRPLERKVSGGHSGRVTPVPIPNTEVKPASADGTWGETPWESRSSPEFISDNAHLLMRVGIVVSAGMSGNVLFVANPRGAPGQRRARGAAGGSQPERRVPPSSRARRSPQPCDANPSVSAEPARRAEDNELPLEVRDELRRVVGPDRSAGLERRLGIATRAYERDRYREALAELRVLARLAPEVAAVRELYGLTLYRLGRWREAVRELRAFHDLTGSFDQHPVIADCERALGRDKAVLAALGRSCDRPGVDREVLVEGRLVMAGMMADRGDLEGAIALFGPGGKSLRHPDTCHLRQWYALGDLYERAGDLPRARELFARVASFEPELFDVQDRLATLR